jgi:hypothetical protein
VKISVTTAMSKKRMTAVNMARGSLEGSSPSIKQDWRQARVPL